MKPPLLLVGVAAGVVLSVFGFDPRSTFDVGRFAAGDSEGCSFASVIGIRARESERNRFAKRIAAESALVTTDGAGFELWRTPSGSFWMPPGNGIAPLSFLLAMMEQGFYGDIGELVRPGDVVLDCGAHVGVFTRRALASGARRVIAVEPSPANVTCLLRTFTDEIRQGRVIVCEKAVSDTPDEKVLHLDRKDSMRDSFVLPRPEAGEMRPVPVTTIDELVQEIGPNVDVIKIHVEGAERNALAGARRTIKRRRPRIVLPAFHLADDFAEITKLSIGYRMSCGPCVREHGRLRPEMIFLNP